MKRILSLVIGLAVCFGWTVIADAGSKPQSGVRGARDAKIVWYGQSFFVVESRSGARIAFDPYHVQDGIRYSPPEVRADAVFVSHEHFDHNNAGIIKGGPKVLQPLEKGTRAGTLVLPGGRFAYRSVFTYHDEKGGKERGGNTVNVLAVDGVRICHLGDLGTTLTAAQVREIGPVDILLVPVGGTFTIDARGADRVVSQLKPRVVIPMHYRTERTDLPLAGVGDFLKGKAGVHRVGETYSFDKTNLPQKTTIVVMKYKTS